MLKAPWDEKERPDVRPTNRGATRGGHLHFPATQKVDDFKTLYGERVLEKMKPGTRVMSEVAIAHFERVAKPDTMKGITTDTIAGYVSKRRGEPIRKGGPMPAPATINRELRTLRSLLRKAHKWGWLPKLPEIEFLKEAGKLAVYVTPEHFAALYQACATTPFALPTGNPYPPADWWRGLLTMAYMTGWRIGSLMAMRWEDVDLDTGIAISRAADNKGGRDQRVPLHPVVVDHLRRLKSFSPLVFTWNSGRRPLWDEFHRLQEAAGVKPDGKPAYGFHDLRRAFATLNAANLTPDTLQALMQHKDYQTTQRYINMARQLNATVEKLYVPAVSLAAAN